MKIRLKDGTEFKISSLKYFYVSPSVANTPPRYVVYFDFHGQNDITSYIKSLKTALTNENASVVKLFQDNDDDTVFKFGSVDKLICETTFEGRLVLHANFYPSEV